MATAVDKIEEKKEIQPVFTDAVLDETERGLYKFVKERLSDLQESREGKQFGTDIEKVWADADKDYVPHRLGTAGSSRRMLVQDEDKGWRSQLTTISGRSWQSDVSYPNPYIKIQTALSILIDQNPSGVFTPGAKRFENTTELIRQLYQRSWEVAKSKQQLKLFVFNLAKYGWAIARTYPKKISRNVKVLLEYNEEDPSKSIYEDKEIIEYNDLFRENLDPWNAWIDDMAKPNNPWSIRDWAWRKVYAFDAAAEEFGKFPNWKYVKPKKIGDVTGKRGEIRKTYQEREMAEIFFYENKMKDLFMVIVNDVPVVIVPLPIEDAQGNKKLSCWQAYWTLRHAESPYGIGIYEVIRYDQGIFDRFRNMSIDQLTLAIYKMWFYQGTQNVTDTAEISITPGRGKQVINPKDINWLEVPGPGKEAVEWIQMLKNDLQESSGITDTLVGEVTGKTAFEVAQAKESALKRLKTPLDNVLDALQQDGYITVSLMQLIYSIPEVHKIVDEDLINRYLQETQSDPELFKSGEQGFEALTFPEFPLNLEEDERGNLIETEQTRFLRIKPRFLQWEGIVNIKPQSILTPSKQVDKALELEMWNILIPLLQLPPELVVKPAKAIVKLYDKDPKDILPDFWLQPPLPPEEQPLVVPQEGMGQPQGQPPVQAGAPRVTSEATMPEQPRGFASNVVSKVAGLFR